MAQLLGLDLGTTGAKALAVNSTGEVLATHTEEYPLYQPEQGWSEQHTDEWWEAIVTVINVLLEKEKVKTKEVAGIALSGQMHGSVFLDGMGEVIRPPILWNDTRTAEQCDEIIDKIGKRKLLDFVGNPALEGFTAPKVLWLRENEPDNYKLLETLLLPKDYIVYRLTGRKVTETSDAAGTILYDVENEEWSKEVCSALEIDTNILPPVLESADVVGKVTEEVSEMTGLPNDVKVVAGGADNACAAVGNGINEEGLFLVSIGSSGVVLAHSNQMSVDYGARVHSFNHSIPNKWYLMGVMLSAGLSFRWLRDQFAEAEKQVAKSISNDAYELLTREASRVPAGSEGLVFLPYLGGERTPHRNANARGVFFGFSGSHKKRHFIRAVLEGVTFGLQDSLELIKGMGVSPEQIRVTGGGAKSKLWRQIQSDVFNREVATTSVDEGPAYGAALLAGAGSGVYENVDTAIKECVSIETTQQPTPKNVNRYEDLYPIYRSLYKSLKEDYEDLANFTKKW